MEGSDLKHGKWLCGDASFCQKDKSEFEKVSEWDTTIQDTMEEYDDVER